jgi:hypothetical protein
LVFIGGLMLAGKQFRLERATLALSNATGKERAVTIPAGDVVKVVAEPSTKKNMLDLLWNGQVVEMFMVDFEGRATELSDHHGAKDRNASAELTTGRHSPPNKNSLLSAVAGGSGGRRGKDDCGLALMLLDGLRV